jgi:uncharacterized surface protein with fasciclin (FAS1) repeats
LLLSSVHPIHALSIIGGPGRLHFAHLCETPFKGAISMSTMSKTPGNTTPQGAKNLVDTIAAYGSFNTFTLFAPTDAAFAKLPPGKLEELMRAENKDELVSLLSYHVIPGRSTSADVAKLNTAKTINGKMAPIALKGTKVTFDGAEVVEPDILSSNGVLHGQGQYPDQTLT